MASSALAMARIEFVLGSAIILILLALFSGKKKLVSIFGVLSIGALLSYLILSEFIDTLYLGYIDDQHFI